MSEERRRFRAAMAQQFELEQENRVEEKIVRPEIFLFFLIAASIGFLALSTLILPS
jgi:hypothetical protein